MGIEHHACAMQGEAEPVVGRSPAVRRYRDLYHTIIEDIGGIDQTSEAQRQLARRAAAMCVQAEQMEAARRDKVAGSAAHQPGTIIPPSRGKPPKSGHRMAAEGMQFPWRWNTAAPDGTPGAQGFSGLARAFFYAGTRALLVSHWPVVSDAAVELTTRTFAAFSKDQSIGRSEALRRSMLVLMSNREKPHYAHPIFWAPFAVVGEGGVRRAQ